MAVTGKHGVSAETPKNILFGAGTIHKGLKFQGSTWNFEASVVGATNGGSKLSIIPEITNLGLDGVNVKAKGLAVKTGETASMEVNFAELSKDLIASATLGKVGTSTVTTHDVIESKSDINVGDFWESIGFVGKTLDGKNIIAILENVLITSGFESEGKNKEGSVGKYTFECHAELTGDLDHLPWKIYYPKASA